MGKPKVRFKGYTDDWEQRKLGELAEIVGGGTPSTGVDSYWDGDIDWYAPAEIGEQIYLESSQRKITEEGLNKSSAKILPIGTVLFTSRAGIGKTAILLKEGCTNQGFQSIIPNKEKLDSYFIFTRSEELKRYGETVGAGSTFVEVSGKQMANMELVMPKTMSEQRKIGEYFASLDHLITLHQRKCENAQKLKKYMLQKMFPKNGTNVPEIRFEGFKDAWEQRKLGNIAIRESKCDISSKDLPAVEYEDVIANEGKLNKNILLKQIHKKGIVFDGTQVLYGKLRPYLHNWFNPDFKGVAVGDWWVLKPINIDKSFLYRLIQTKQFDDVANQSTGSKMPRADWNLVSNIEIAVPHSAQEQKKTGEYFEMLDHLITLHQHKCEELKNIKKFMLQNMFVQEK